MAKRNRRKSPAPRGRITTNRQKRAAKVLLAMVITCVIAIAAAL